MKLKHIEIGDIFYVNGEMMIVLARNTLSFEWFDCYFVNGSVRIHSQQFLFGNKCTSFVSRIRKNDTI